MNVQDVEKRVYDYFEQIKESKSIGWCIREGLDIKSEKYKEMLSLVEDLCREHFPELYESIFVDDSVDLIFKSTYDPQLFSLYYYNPDSSAGGQIVNCPFSVEDAAEIIEGEDYIEVLAKNIQYLSDVDSELFFEDIFNLIRLKEDGLYLGNDIHAVCKKILEENDEN